MNSIEYRPLDCVVEINFLNSQPKHMLWVLKRTISIRLRKNSVLCGFFFVYRDLWIMSIAFSIEYRPLDCVVEINFLNSQPKHMLWVLKRTISIRLRKNSVLC